MPRVIHFEFPAYEPERAGKFYQEAFGWAIEKWEGPEPYWLVMTGPEGEPGINGGIDRRESATGAGGEQPASDVVRVTVDVPDIDEYIKRVMDAGGKIVVPKGAVPGVGYLAYFADTEGNISGMMQRDTSASQGPYGVG